jgi:hypothetical protein
MMAKWRVPTLKELMSLWDYEKDPKSQRPNNIGTRYYHWSSTGYEDDVKYVVDFYHGGVTWGNFPMFCRVMCVKQKKNGKLKWSGSSDTNMTYPDAVKYCKRMNK